MSHPRYVGSIKILFTLDPTVCPELTLNIFNMPLVVEKAQEEDIPQLLDIFYAAFHDDPWDLIMFPQVPPPEARTAATNRWRKEISTHPHITFLKVVDTDDDGEIIAFARWHVYRAERSKRDWQDMTRRDWDEGTNVDAANEFLDAVRRKRQKVMRGQPHCCKILLRLTNRRMRAHTCSGRFEYAGHRSKASTKGCRPYVVGMGDRYSR